MAARTAVSQASASSRKAVRRSSTETKKDARVRSGLAPISEATFAYVEPEQPFLAKGPHGLACQTPVTIMAPVPYSPNGLFNGIELFGGVINRLTWCVLRDCRACANRKHGRRPRA